MSESVLAAVSMAGAVVLPAGVAQAQPEIHSGPPAPRPGMHQRHELMTQGNPGITRVHELVHAGH